MSWYSVRIEVWPYSTGNGHTNDQDRAGPREREFILQADDFDAAVVAAGHLQTGIKSSGHVYQAPIRAVACLGERRP